jgi:hypothetical protein
MLVVVATAVLVAASSSTKSLIRSNNEVLFTKSQKQLSTHFFKIFKTLSKVKMNRKQQID